MPSQRLGSPDEAIDRWNRVFTALSSEPRRQLITSLNDASPGRWVRLPEAADSPTDPMDLETLRLWLYHVHLPLLAEHGYVEWSDDHLAARRGTNFDEVAVVFDALYEKAHEIPDELVLGCQRLERERTENRR